MSRRLLLCSLLTVVTTTLSAAPDSSQQVSLKQADGGELVLQAPARRIITLSPHLAELIFAAGAGDWLAATVEYSNFPPEASTLPRVGNAFRVDTERIHVLEPDLVLGWQSGNPAAALGQIAQLGFPVWTIEIRQAEEIPEVVEAIGRAAGTSAFAHQAANELRLKIKGLEQKYSDRSPVSYFYQVAAQPLYTVNGEHLISRALALCGGVNVFAGLAGLAPQVGFEAVLVTDPIAMIAPDIEGQENPLNHWKAWPRLFAVEHENFLLLPGDEISRATPRFLDSVELACAMLDDLR